jgi:hypothetical protein
MPATPADTPILPLRLLLIPPSSLDEAVARCTNASGRLIAQLWDRQRLIENCTVRVQACLFSTA